LYKNIFVTQLKDEKDQNGAFLEDPKIGLTTDYHNLITIFVSKTLNNFLNKNMVK